MRARSAGLHVLILFLSAPISGASLGQNMYVIDTAFCKKMDGKNCVDVIPAGQSVRIADLHSNEKGPVVYFWGSLRNPSDRAVGVIFTRQGECYEEAKALPEKKIRSTPSLFRTMAAFFASLSIADMLGRAGAKDATLDKTVAGVDAKVNFVAAKQSESYRIFDYRNVACAGTFAAVLVDSQSNQLPPGDNNDVKTIDFTE